MNREEHVKYWLDSARHDLVVAESLFKSKKYDWCLYLAHLVLEKTLKAIWVRDNNNSIPPKTHNLLRIAEETKLKLKEEDKLFLLNVNDFNIEVRYPDYRFSFYKKCGLKFTKTKFEEMKGLHKWLTKNV